MEKGESGRSKRVHRRATRESKFGRRAASGRKEGEPREREGGEGRR